MFLDDREPRTAKRNFAPRCGTCRGPSRLLTTEPHPRLKHTDLRTYECEACGAMQTVAAPLPHG